MSSVNLAAIKPGLPPLPAGTTSDAIEGVNWRAVIAGAVAAAALSFLMLVLGVGLGLSAVSPWSFEGVTGPQLAISAIVWIIVTEIAASGVGGYMAGRLRGRWQGLRDPEVYFRDTAHGLLAWGVSTLIMVAVMGSAVSGVVNQATRATGAAATLAQSALVGDKNGGADPGAYWIDVLLRTDPAKPAAPNTAVSVMDPSTDAVTRAQALRILVRSLQAGAMAPDDARYLAGQVSLRTGLTLQEAQLRVNDGFARAKKALQDAQADARHKADEARKASAYTALWMFVALLAGAFVSAWLATYGGRQRDAAVAALV